MSTTVDERVVEMRFDNKQFEKNVQTTLSTLDKLKARLKLTDSAKGLESVGRAANNVRFDGINSGIQTVEARFSAMSAVAFTVFQNITNSAIRAGEGIISALTIDPVKTGFSEYELKMGSIQTIMASTGKSLKVVNKYLNELNEYSDKTIYSFSDMTQNIGKFTNAGVKLKTAVKSIQGVSNLAAVSGANANEASRAMYNFAQALSAGHVKLIDWKSIENANMATVEFKNELIKSALAMGTIVKVGDKYKTTTTDLKGHTSELFDATKGFNDSLSHQWMTTKVLTKTLNKYSDETTKLGKKAFAAAQDVKTFTQLFDTLKESAQSGWAQSWELAVGNFNQAKKLYSDMYLALGGMIEASAKSRNAVIKDWKKLGGRTDIIEGVRNLFRSTMEVVELFGEAFEDIFPTDDLGERLAEFSENFRKMTENMDFVEEHADELRRTFKGLFALLDIISTITSGTLKTALRLFCKLIGAADDDIISMSASAGDAIVKFRDWLLVNNRFAKGFDSVITNIGNGISKIREWIDEFMKLPIVQNNIDRFNDAIDNVSSDAGEYFAEGGKKILEFIERIKSMDSITLDDVDGIFEDFKENVVGYFTNISVKFDSVGDSVDAFKEDVKKYLDESGKDLDGFKEKVVTFTESVGSKFSNIGFGEILTVGMGLGLIASMKELSGSIKKAYFTHFKGIMYDLSGVLKAWSMNLRADALLKIAGAIAILAASVALLTFVDQTKLATAVAALAGLAVGLMAFASAFAILERFNLTDGVKKLSLSMALVAVSMLILVEALKRLENINTDKVVDSLFILGTIAGTLVVASVALSRYAPNLSKNSFTLLAFATSLKILVSTFDDISKLDRGQINKALTVMLTAMGGLAAVSIAASRTSIGSALSVLAIVIALKILVSAFEDIADMDTAKMKGNLGAFVAIFGAFAILMMSSHLAGQHAAKAGVAIVAMSVSLLIITQALKQMAKIDANALSNATNSIITMLGVFGGIVLLSNFAGQHATKAGAMLLMMSGAIAILTGVVVVLSKIDPSGLWRAVGAISTLEIVFGLLIGITHFAGRTKGVKSTLIVLTTAIGVMAVALGALSMIEPANLATATGALSMLMGMFAVLIGVSATAKTAIGPLASITATVAVLGLIMVSIGVLANKFESMETFIDKSIPILGKLGYGLGSFLGSIIGGISAGALSGLPAIGEHLGGFMTNMKPFFKGLENVDSKATDGVKSIAEMVLILTAANVVKGIASFVGLGNSSLVGFGEELAEFGPHFAKYAKSVKDIDGETIQKSSNAAKTLAEFAKAIPNSGGKLAELVGENSIVVFGEELAKFGPKFAKYAKSVKDINGETVAKSADAAKTLAEFAKAVPNMGGKLAELVGENSLAVFGEELAKFGPNFSKYAKSVEDVNVKTVEKSANAAKTLADFASAIPNQGASVLSDLVGDNKLSTFGDELAKFGPKFAEYALSVADIKTSVVEKSVDAARTLSTFADGIPNSGGLVWLFTGDNTLTQFGDHLVSFGKSFSEYSTLMSGVDTNVVSATSNAAKSLVALEEALPKDGGIFSGDISLKDFGKLVVAFGKQIKKFYGHVDEVDPTKMKSVVDSLSGLALIAKGVSSVNSDSIDSFGDALVKIAKNGIDSLFEEFNNSKEEMGTAVTSFLNSGLTSIKNKYVAFYNAGTYLVEGFVNGIKDEAPNASAAAGEMAKASKDAAKKELDEHSPSKEFYKIGAFAGKGFVNALSDYSSRTYKAGSEMASSAKSGFSNAMSNIKALLDSDMDVRPTIRPIMDLSDVSSGVGVLNGMLDINPSIGTLSNIHSINSMMSKNQNGRNDDVVSAIDSLKKTLGNISGNTYHVNGITYDDGSNVSQAVETLVRAVKVGGRT